MSFQFILKLNKDSTISIRSSKFTKNQKKVYLLLLTSTSDIIIYDIRITDPIAIFHVDKIIVQYFQFMQGNLLYGNHNQTFIINVNSKQIIHQKFNSGIIFCISGKEYLSLKEQKTLERIYVQNIQNKNNANTLNITIFEDPILDYIGSKTKDIFVILSNKTYILKLNGNTIMQMEYVFSKLLFCDDSNLAGLSIDKQKIVIRNIQAGISIFQITMNICRSFQIYKQKIYILQQKQLKIKVFDINQEKKSQIRTNYTIQDIYIGQVAVYIIAEDLNLYGITLENIDNIKQKLDKFQSKQQQQSLIYQDFSKASYIIDNQEFQIKGLINNSKQEHFKIMNILNERNNSLKSIYKWWNNRNQKAAIYAIEKHQNISVVNDSLRLISRELQKIPLDMMEVMIRIGVKLLQSRYNTHVQSSIIFLNGLFENLNREKISKSILNELQNVKKNKRFIKLLNSNYSQTNKHIFENIYTMNLKLEKLIKYT